MRIKLKICGVTSIEDAIEISRIGVDYIGVVNDLSSPRYRPLQFIDELKKYISTPIVSVRVSGDITTFYNTSADYIQIHRVLSDEELEIVTTFSKKTILYVPASLDYIDYLKKAQRATDLILFDSPKKGIRSDPKILRILLNYHPDAGVGGGINIENIHEYLALEPKWIDVSSGVEISIGKKDLNLVKRLKEAVDSWRR
ncbi:N-(5'phosphoribosyl)anthranilate isomerase (PRAI) [Ignisphaera aggregans DSM 17230]|uniref:N-(5'-phosphoribosyl)anthranilate isomerase n=1 Tax=Ignisphaera aggregans (strain DSM 17230 / JCM 13409 / AQ1.S1) TaxID=583356 RepID=E0SS59_IGNAA|nr:N-(5'phosphoribosyl)anthranilate isomerase (PRAI) [Ignisphaera aggregans DSM 17230]